MYAQMAAYRRVYWENLLGLEGQVLAEIAEAYEGLGPDDDVVFVEDMYGLDEQEE